MIATVEGFKALDTRLRGNDVRDTSFVPVVLVADLSMPYAPADQMLPNNRIVTMLSRFHQIHGAGYDIFYSEAVVFHHFGPWGRRAEVVHSYHLSFIADPA